MMIGYIILSFVVVILFIITLAQKFKLNTFDVQVDQSVRIQTKEKTAKITELKARVRNLEELNEGLNETLINFQSAYEKDVVITQEKIIELRQQNIKTSSAKLGLMLHTGFTETDIDEIEGRYDDSTIQKLRDHGKLLQQHIQKISAAIEQQRVAFEQYAIPAMNKALDSENTQLETYRNILKGEIPDSNDEEDE